MVLPNQANPFKQSSGATAQATLPGAGHNPTPTPGGAPLPGGAGTSRGKIQLAHTLENVEQSGLLTIGQHPAVIQRVEEVVARTGSQGIKFHLLFINFDGVETNNPNAGRHDTHTVYVTPKAMWKVKNTFCAVGQCDVISEFDMEAAQGVLVMVDVTKESFTPTPTEANPNPSPRDSTKCDTLIEWPAHLGGAGAKYQG